MIRFEKVTKLYGTKDNQKYAIDNVSISIAEGEFVAIMGPSGAGKTTFLHLCAGLLKPNDGFAEVNKIKMTELTLNDSVLFRRKNIGLIFQDFQLLPTLNVEENMSFILHADRLPKKAIRERVEQLVQAVDLQGLEKKFPDQLSGGEQQRVAIARALANSPKVLLADEPTGSLDRNSGRKILNLLMHLNKKEKQTIVMATHDLFAAGFADKIIILKDGKIVQVINQKENDQNALMESFLEKLAT